MSQKIKNPNDKGNGFVVGLVALIAVIAVVVGAVVYMGRNQPLEGLPNEDVKFNVALDGDVIRLSADNAKDAKTATVYEDYSCHYCADMANGGHADELKALNDGKLIVEHRTLNFLDNRSKLPPTEVQGHSTQTYAIARMIAKSGDAKVFWNFHTMMMKDQQTSVTWKAEELAKRLQQLGASSEIVDEVRNGIDLKDAQLSADANGKFLEGKIGSISSPHVFVGDKDVLKEASQGGLGEWVKLALKA